MAEFVKCNVAEEDKKYCIQKLTENPRFLPQSNSSAIANLIIPGFKKLEEAENILDEVSKDLKYDPKKKI